MVAIVLIHMVQVVLFGAYKFPRELTWIVGVFLLLMTLGMAFTGQVLRFDQDAYWGLGIGASICGRVPLHWRLGGALTVGRSHHRRRYAVAILRAACVRHSRPADRICLASSAAGIEAGDQRMADARARSCAALPTSRNITSSPRRTACPSCRTRCGRTCSSPRIIIVCVVACAAFFGPFGPSGQPDPTIMQTVPKPDYFFLWLYAVLACLPPEMETPALLIGPVVIIGFLVLPAVLCRRRREELEAAADCGGHDPAVAVALGTLTHLAELHAVEPGHGRLERRSGAGAVSARALAAGTPGRAVFQEKQCRNCHAHGAPADSGARRSIALRCA